MGETVLSLKDIVVEYGSDRILDSVSIDVHEGEILGIQGKNGAGKSTLIGIMAGTVKPRSGTRTELTDLSGKICYVPQDIALYPSLTGRQNLEFWAEAYGLRGQRKRARIRFLLDLMNLSDKANKRVETYSGGMKRRLNMAAALVITPKLLLLDEPTVGADKESVAVMLDIVKRMSDNGAAVVLISHISDELGSVCSRFITLAEGKIAE
ncbi:MAG: ABC transporter ATP-binding protein [Clostridia bacterium]|nr:ABC transporter ATP-binding protein [Clostridia bacterium]